MPLLRGSERQPQKEVLISHHGMRCAFSRAILDHDAAALQQLELRHSLGQLFVPRHIVERVETIELDAIGIGGLVRLEKLHHAVALAAGAAPWPKNSVNFTGRSRLWSCFVVSDESV